MNLSIQERQELAFLLSAYLSDPLVLQMKDFIQHGSVTTFDHCGNVVRVSFWLNRRMHLGADEKSLVIGALLHDFYLYDWHDPNHAPKDKLHGFAHPAIACQNASIRFSITRKEQNIISCHMWPLTLLHVPACREAVIVCLADKYCSLLETLTQRKAVHPICL